jgi:hypothetical protein
MVTRTAEFEHRPLIGFFALARYLEEGSIAEPAPGLRGAV